MPVQTGGEHMFLSENTVLVYQKAVITLLGYVISSAYSNFFLSIYSITSIDSVSG